MKPILLMGGTGAIGRLTARALRDAHPDLPLLIGGRDAAKCAALARDLGNADGVAIDLTADDLGLGDLGLGDRAVSAVAVFFADARLAGLRYAHARGLPHLGISSGIYEIAPEVATFMHDPSASAIVLGYEWLVGATTVSTLAFAEAYARVDAIAIGALVDEEDGGGPAVAEDFERLSKMMPAALTRRDGAYVWRHGADARATFRAIDGTLIEATGFSSIDVVGLATALGAPNVSFDLATGVSSSPRAGGARSTEIIVELSGVDHGGAPLSTRHAVLHPGGAAPLTVIGVTMILERLTGLDGRDPAGAGLLFPYQLIEPAEYFRRLGLAGGRTQALETT